MLQASYLGQRHIEVATNFAGEEVGNFHMAWYGRGMIIVHIREYRVTTPFSQQRTSVLVKMFDQCRSLHDS